MTVRVWKSREGREERVSLARWLCSPLCYDVLYDVQGV